MRRARVRCSGAARPTGAVPRDNCKEIVTLLRGAGKDNDLDRNWYWLVHERYLPTRLYPIEPPQPLAAQPVNTERRIPESKDAPIEPVAGGSSG